LNLLINLVAPPLPLERRVPPHPPLATLEYLGKVVQTKQVNSEVVAFPDSLVGTDSHTTMINALGILGWGVGGIEAEAVMLGQPYYMLIPQVVGVKLTGELPEGATATDLVLTVTQMLRRKGVVDKFVEFYGPGLSSLTVEDRATIANMAPEYGATMGFFPVDQRTLDYLRFTGRHESLVRLVEAYCKENALFRTDETPDPEYSDTLELDLSTVEPSLAGPKRPHDRVPLREMRALAIDAQGNVYVTGWARQYNSDYVTIKYEQLRTGDVNGDGCVDDSDLLAVLFAFGDTGSNLPEDLNGDGTVDDADLLEVLFNFGSGC